MGSGIPDVRREEQGIKGTSFESLVRVHVLTYVIVFVVVIRIAFGLNVIKDRFRH